MARGEGPHENARNISDLAAVKEGITDVIRWRRTLQRPCDATAPWFVLPQPYEVT